MQKSIYTREHKILVEKLYQMRINQGLRQEDLAKKLGVNQSYISKIESGEKRIDIIELKNICRCLNVSLTDLINELEGKI